jgi:3-dehydroquinate dehydratase II
MIHIYVLNGPNLNLLGTRQPDIYGTQTLSDIQQICGVRAKSLGATIDFHQSNIEGELVNWIHEAKDKAKGLVINAGAYTHTSVALFDAIKAVGLPAVEVHLSNIHQREAFRHHSYMSAAALGVICGFGAMSYELALEGLVHHIKKSGMK